MYDPDPYNTMCYCLHIAVSRRVLCILSSHSVYEYSATTVEACRAVYLNFVASCFICVLAGMWLSYKGGALVMCIFCLGPTVSSIRWAGS